MSAGLDILLVEDNQALAANIIDYLESRGHRLHFAADGPAGLRAALETPVDVVVLDIALPRMDGLALCEQLRAQADRRVPVLMLTARDTLDDKLAGFASGADDYLTKPFALAELAARVEVLSGRGSLGADYTLAIGDLVIDRRARTATRAGTPLRLTPIPWQMLLLLAEAYPAALPRSELSRRIWGEEPPSSDSLRSNMHLLRQVLDRPFAAPMLETVHGVGYRLVVAA
ncbi:response regulator transcription factor [Sphingoaurantiacus capsulatus]|uniref:Response regulator transcription factor n=1 Tax=Sphingoaurantiacus capsulatus TaxID=1771310 RepID=A0ABV7XBD0_9SPHN